MARKYCMAAIVAALIVSFVGSVETAAWQTEKMPISLSENSIGLSRDCDNSNADLAADPWGNCIKPIPAVLCSNGPDYSAGGAATCENIATEKPRCGLSQLRYVGQVIQNAIQKMQDEWKESFPIARAKPKEVAIEESITAGGFIRMDCALGGHELPGSASYLHLRLGY